MEYVYKEEFSVIGKLGQGKAENPWEWIMPIWNEANSSFGEIDSLLKKNTGVQVWGIMSDFGENFKRWDENGGKYLACCEVEADVVAPTGWTKWTVPSQTYLVERCNQSDYLRVFNSTIDEYIPNHSLQLIGAVHEHYPEPGNPSIVELYFPIAFGNFEGNFEGNLAEGKYFCQSCGMPMSKEEDRGTEKDLSKSKDYCVYCYQNGAFTSEQTMDEMIESCIPFSIEGGVYPDADTARKVMQAYFPKLKRWQHEKEA